MGSDNKKEKALPKTPIFGQRPGEQTPIQPKGGIGRLAGTSRDKAFYNFSDPSDQYANAKGYYIQFEYFHGDEAVKFVSFKAFITEFTDNYSSNWNSEDVYGRPDPIHTFQNTTRTINISWDVPSAGFAEAQENLAKASKMMRFLYPSYREDSNASTITKPPLLRMKFVNLIKKDDTKGLLGKAAGFTFAPDLEVGFWDGHPNGLGETFSLYPKLLRFSCEFSVIHEHHLGWHDCTGLWEVVCGKDGKQKLDKDKAAWPYAPYGDSANELLYIPDPLNKESVDDVINDTVNDGLGDATTAADSQKVDRSSASAQGVTKSEEENARKAKESQQGSQPLAVGVVPEEETEAELNAALEG